MPPAVLRRLRAALPPAASQPKFGTSDTAAVRLGDRVEQTADGWLKIAGRVGDMINVGGEKVAPAAVEAVLLEMPEIVECAARGEASALAGEIVVADVVWREPAIDAVAALRAVRTFCRARLAAHEIPVKIYLRMPETSEATLKKRRRVV
jgi:acyl-coenzyme A synthetase/AMP-(fatty) acid ligase